MVHIPFTDSLRQEYQGLYDTCEIAPDHLPGIDRFVATIQENRARYEAVGTPLGIPWYVVAAIHSMESSLNFKCHLHNGDPLTARTVQEPPGRPLTPDPPYTWEQGANDALTFKHLDQVTDWTLPCMLYQIEGYNGFGYRAFHPLVLTPYLWSWSNHYTSGKYVADGKFDPDAVSKQGGAAVLLRRMADRNIISLDEVNATPVSDVPVSATPADPKAALLALASQVTFSNSERSDAARALQEALNRIQGIHLNPDGIPGSNTSAALQSVTGQFLAGDPRAQTQAAGGD